MTWKMIGAVESCPTSGSPNDLREGAGQNVPLPRKGYFERRPHHMTGLELLGLAIIAGWTLLFILAVHIPDFHCRQGDVATTNGRDLCPAHSVPR